MDDWVAFCRVDESHYVGGPTRRGLTLGVFCLEALSHPYVMCLSNVEGGGLLADGQT